MDRKPVLIVSHADCFDGALAAAIADLALTEQGKAVVHYPQEYGKETPIDFKDHEVYIVDFCYSRDVMEKLNNECSRLVLLDHHITAQSAMKGFKCRCGEVHFDMNESGASLTWKHFFNGSNKEEMPRLVQHIRDQDLWKFEIEHTEAVTAYLDTFKKDLLIDTFKAMLIQGDNCLDPAYSVGSHLVTYRDNLVQSLEDEAQTIKFLGHTVLAAAAPYSLVSFLGSRLAKKTGTFAVPYTLKADGTVKLSLRSVPGFSVTEMAQSLGGGEHPCASGAVLKDPELIRQFLAGSLALPK